MNQKVLEYPGIVHLDGRALSRPRTYSIEESLVKDINVLMSLLLCGKEMVILDRWLLSSIVYDYLRGTLEMPDQSKFDLMMTGYTYTVKGLQQALQERGVQEVPEEIQFNFMFNIPNEDDLYARRRPLDRVFPFPGREEIAAYRHVKSLLSNFIELHEQWPQAEFEMQDVTEGMWEW